MCSYLVNDITVPHSADRPGAESLGDGALNVRATACGPRASSGELRKGGRACGQACSRWRGFGVRGAHARRRPLEWAREPSGRFPADLFAPRPRLMNSQTRSENWRHSVRLKPCTRNATTGRTGRGVVYLDRFYAHESGELKIVLGRERPWTHTPACITF